MSIQTRVHLQCDICGAEWPTDKPGYLNKSEALKDVKNWHFNQGLCQDMCDKCWINSINFPG